MQVKIIKLEESTETPVSHNPAFLKKVFLRNGDVPNLIQLASAEFGDGDVVEEHSHESMSEIFCVIKGGLDLETDNSHYRLSTGAVFVIYPKTRHKLSFICKTKLLYLGLNA